MSGVKVSDVRSPFDLGSFEKYIEKSSQQGTTFGLNVPKLVPPFQVKQFDQGQSNPTYLLTDSNGFRFVLRRKPSPNNKLVSKSAHAVEREFFILKAIQECNRNASKKVPIATPYLLCEDEAVIGYVFYLMQFVDGYMVKNPAMPHLPPDKASRYWNSIMDTLTAIHSLDTDILLQHLPASHFPQFQPEAMKKAKGTSYFQRQIKTLSAVANKQSQVVDPIPDFARLCEYVEKNAPSDPSKKALIHGDFKIDNILFDPKRDTVMAVIDWELCTMGHPIFDLANLLQPFELPNKLNLLLYHPDVTEIGIESADSKKFVEEKLKQYSKLLGHEWDPSDPSNNPLDKWSVGYVFGLLRLCVISQGIAMRMAKGSASSAQASHFASLYKPLSQLALGRLNSPSSKL
ncbi:Piso0_004408 [Millerozyma farinosa CBS 7064]|uniref:Piso0_004408 protein n=1 Tax=Pichia sorbitophila (strain ATCC MYA-4447 / BCRC 22081 / CBS 7064 / NBRC 10061 / NRRL Y-12695) TaxID=559304 RepID=G8Y5D9_PICSO|nr:Piso0_004408 [Millerozyma farinosa CBS 7064]CCE84850.1 Piso0_004408 [Millerozyma farinosa CBS 7064]